MVRLRLRGLPMKLDRLNRTLDCMTAPGDLAFIVAVGPCLLVWCLACVVGDGARWLAYTAMVAMADMRYGIQRANYRFFSALAQLPREI